MNRQEIEDRQLVERYLRGALTPEEEQQLEEAYLADSALLDELELTERLRDGLKTVGAARGSPHGTVHPSKTWRSVLASPRYAVAASVLLAFSLLSSAVLLVQNMGLRATAEPSRVAAGATRLLPLVNVRGDGGNVVEAPAPAETTVFMLDPGFTEYASYRVTVMRRGGAAPFDPLEVEGLSRTYEEYVAVAVPGSVLAPGDYEITLEGLLATAGAPPTFETITRTSVTVVPRD